MSNIADVKPKFKIGQNVFYKIRKGEYELAGKIIMVHYTNRAIWYTLLKVGEDDEFIVYDEKEASLVTVIVKPDNTYTDSDEDDCRND